MKENYKSQEKIYDAEVLESSTFDENIIIKILIKAGRTIAKPACLRSFGDGIRSLYSCASESFINGCSSIFDYAI